MWQQEQVQTRWKRGHLKVSSVAHRPYCLSFQRAPLTSWGHSLEERITPPVSFISFTSISDTIRASNWFKSVMEGPLLFPRNASIDMEASRFSQRHWGKSSPLGCVRMFSKMTSSSPWLWLVELSFHPWYPTDPNAFRSILLRPIKVNGGCACVLLIKHSATGNLFHGRRILNNLLHFTFKETMEG